MQTLQVVFRFSWFFAAVVFVPVRATLNINLEAFTYRFLTWLVEFIPYFLVFGVC